MDRHILTAGVIVLLLLPCVTHAQDWQATLIATESGGFEPQSTLRVQLPATVTAATLEWLALELDNVDVSQVVSLEQSDQGYTVALTPPQPLAAGEHVLRLVEYTPDGQITERGAWAYTIRHPAGLANAVFSGNTTLDLSRRFADDDLEGAPGRNQLNGSTVFAARGASMSWDFNGRADLLYDTAQFQAVATSPVDSTTANAGDPNTTDPATVSGGTVQPGGETEEAEPVNPYAGGHSIELGEYLFEGRGDSLQALLGHHALTHDSLVMREFNRRGASLTAATAGGLASASAFAFRTEPIVGWRDGLGITNGDHRVVGAVLSANPLRQHAQALALTGTCLSGKGQDGTGVGVEGNFNEADGNACSLVADSLLAGEKVRLRGEYAGSDFDFDGAADGFASEKDNAWDILAIYSPLKTEDGPVAAINWDVGAEVQQVGLYYRSLANPTLPADRELQRLFTTLQWGGLSLQAQAGTEQDNVADDPALPTLHNRIGNLAVSYSPAVQTDAQGVPVLRWYGQPTLSFTSQYGKQDHASLPAELEDYRIAQKTLYNQAAVAFQYLTWSWQAGYGLGNEKDEQGGSFDRDSTLGNLAFNWQLSERLTLGLQGQKNRVEDTVTALTTDSELVGVNADAMLIRDKVRLTLGYNLAQDEASDDSIDTRTQTWNGNLDWQVKQPRGFRPGLGLWLRGEWQEREDRVNPDLATSPYQVFAGIRIGWPVTYPGAAQGSMP